MLNDITLDHSRRSKPNSVPITFAAILALGLFVFTPVVGLGLRALGVPGFFGPLAALAITLGVYGVLTAASGYWFIGSLVALLMLVTYGANVPLADMGNYPMALSPAIWIYQIPLLAATALGVHKGLHRLKPTLPEILLVGFVVWSGISAVFSNVLRPDVAIFFTLFFLQVAIVFGLVFRSVRQNILPLRDVIGVFCVTAIGHVMIALVQFMNEGPLGLSVLGETSKFIGKLGFGPYVIWTGAWVTGFTGGGLNSLILLTFPAMLVFAWRSESRARLFGFVIVFAMLLVQRGTASDSGRGAIFVVGILLGLSMLWYKRGSLPKLATLQNIPVVGGVIVGLTILLYPDYGSGKQSSSTLGQTPFGGDVSAGSKPAPNSTTLTTTSDPTTTATTTETTTATTTETTTATTPETTTAMDAVTTTTETTTQNVTTTTETPTTTTETTTTANGSQGPPSAESLVNDMSVPFFSLKTLGVRIRQYAAGMDLFAKNPIFGIGGGNFRYHAEAYGLSKPFRMHSLYVALLTETGIIGFALYLGAVLVALFSGGKLLFSQKADRVLIIAVCCSLVGVLGAAAWGPFLDKVPRVFPFWAVLAALAGEYYRLKTDGSSNRGVLN